MALEDVMDSQDSRLEVFLRMNDDQEKDYCFSVGINDTFRSLVDVFTTLKLSLRPSPFYDQVPVGFEVSTDPGYLTLWGGLLFTDNAEKTVKQVSLDDKISDKVWPGQLILPVWRHKPFNHLAVVSLLLAWLYTDLPDVWSPTPGICLTNQITKIIAFVLLQFDKPELAEDMLLEVVPGRTGFTGQMLFFGFHVFKILMIYFTVHFGLFNPYSLNPLVVYHTNKTDKIDESKREQLQKIGWTGSRRATLTEFKDYYREVEVARVGGIVKASKMGLFERLKNPGVDLGPGEGFQTELDSKHTLKELEEQPDKFYLSYDYFIEIGSHFESQLESSNNVTQDIKNFRKFGPTGCAPKLEKIVEARREVWVEQDKLAQDKKNK